MTQSGLQVQWSRYPHWQLFGFMRDANYWKFWIWRFEIMRWGKDVNKGKC